MKAKRITVEGEVQRVGYRDYIQKIGLKLNIRGYVKNDEEYPNKVEIVAVYEDENSFNEFLSLLKNPPYPASVENVKIEDTEIPEEEYKIMKIIRGDPTVELAERLDQAMYFFRSLDNKQERMLEKQDQTLEEIRKLNEKQDKTLEEIRKLNEKQDQMLEKQDQTLNEIRNMNENMQKRFDVMEEKYGSISKTLERIADALELLTSALKKKE